MNDEFCWLMSFPIAAPVATAWSAGVEEPPCEPNLFWLLEPYPYLVSVEGESKIQAKIKFSILILIFFSLFILVINSDTLIPVEFDSDELLA